jgi:CheY-like chemotaxis protein
VQAPQVLVVSAYDTEELRQSISKLAITHFLPKPVLPASLQQIFAGLHDGIPTVGTPASQQSLSLKGMRVLLVEDQPINQQLAMELLRDMDVSPDLAQHGGEAISMLAAHEPDYYSLVLMDLQMPVLDGHETTKRVRADARYARLPIVAMTAHVTLEERERSLALGMRGHIGKPIDPDELHRLVASFFRREAGQQPATVTVTDAAQASVTSLPRQVGQIDASTTLPRLEGLDIQAGLNRTRGKQDFYLNLLKQFAADFRSFAEQLAQCLREGKHEDAQRLAHSLKGVAANLGAHRVADAASELERVLRSGEPLETALQRVERELFPLVTGLADHFGTNLVDTGPPDSPTEHRLASVPLPEWVDDLRRLLNEGDIAAQQLWAQRGEELKDLMSVQTYGQIRRALENFEFEAALEALSTPLQPGQG